MYTDPIADMLTRLRNSQLRGSSQVEMPYSNVKKNLADILKENGFVKDVKVFKTDKGFKGLNIKLNDIFEEKSITGIDRISKPGNRKYVKSKDIKNIYGIYIISTSRGLVTSIDAKRKKLGGEIICKVY